MRHFWIAPLLLLSLSTHALATQDISDTGLDDADRVASFKVKSEAANLQLESYRAQLLQPVSAGLAERLRGQIQEATLKIEFYKELSQPLAGLAQAKQFSILQHRQDLISSDPESAQNSYVQPGQILDRIQKSAENQKAKLFGPIDEALKRKAYRVELGILEQAYAEMLSPPNDEIRNQFFPLPTHAAADCGNGVNGCKKSLKIESGASGSGSISDTGKVPLAK